MERPAMKRCKTYEEYRQAMDVYERWKKSNPDEKQGFKAKSPSFEETKKTTATPQCTDGDVETEKDGYRAGALRIARYRHQSQAWRSKEK